MDLYLLAKALHIVGFVSWFAGLFYIVRLFVYHAHADQRPPAERIILQDQLALMQRRLWRIITTPAMVFTVVAGTATAYLRFGWSFPPWFQIKIVLLTGLLIYHHACGRIYRAQQQGRSTWSANRLRMFNEVGTLFAVAIVFLAVFKSGLSALWGALGLVSLGIVLMVAIRLYRRTLQENATHQSSGSSK